MPNPTVPRRANQIPRSLPAGVGGGDGFGHHPKPVLPGPETPADFPMRQRRYRGPGGGDYQWDSKTETPVWREVPRDKNLPKRQYSPSPREQFPNSYKKSRYKPGTLRIPTQNPPEKPVLRPVKKPSDWIKKGVKGGIIDFFKDEALKPAGGSDGTIPGSAFPGLPPIPIRRNPQPPSVCGTKLDRAQWGARKGDTLEVHEYGIWVGGRQSETPNSGRVQYVKINNKWVGPRPRTVLDFDMAISDRFSVSFNRFNILTQETEEILYGWVYEIEVRHKAYVNKVGWIYDEGTGIGYQSVLVGGGKGGGSGLPKKRRYTYFDMMDTWLAQDHGAVPIYKPEKIYRVGNPIYPAAYLLCIASSSPEDDDGDNNFEPDDDYDFDVDEDTEMGCKWQKDEVSYALPELKIGDSKIGGNSIAIDDGLIPLADFLVNAVAMMHQGLGLQNLDIAEFDKVLGDPSKGKLKPASLSELVHWQFENVSSLVGLPSAQEIVTIDNEKKDFAFRNVQDALTFLYHQQKESDMDLKIIETYNAKTAQQLEAVTQIALRQTADLEMIIQELGIKWKWERKERPSLYKHGMSDEDEKTGILELFKGGTVAYPVRIWADEVDSKQVALRTNLYAEMAAQSTLTRINSSEGIPGLDARTRMKSGDDEAWKEWVKAINIPEKGTVSGVPTPYIKEYEKGSLEAKNIGAPTSALSVFMKPKKAPKK